MGTSRPLKESAMYLVEVADYGKIKGAVHAPSRVCLLGFCGVWVVLDPPSGVPVVLTYRYNMQCKTHCKVKFSQKYEKLPTQLTGTMIRDHSAELDHPQAPPETDIVVSFRTINDPTVLNDVSRMFLCASFSFLLLYAYQ